MAAGRTVARRLAVALLLAACAAAAHAQDAGSQQQQCDRGVKPGAVPAVKAVVNGTTINVSTGEGGVACGSVACSPPAGPAGGSCLGPPAWALHTARLGPAARLAVPPSPVRPPKRPRPNQAFFPAACVHAHAGGPSRPPSPPPDSPTPPPPCAPTANTPLPPPTHTPFPAGRRCCGSPPRRPAASTASPSASRTSPPAACCPRARWRASCARSSRRCTPVSAGAGEGGRGRGWVEGSGGGGRARAGRRLRSPLPREATRAPLLLAAQQRAPQRPQATVSRARTASRRPAAAASRAAGGQYEFTVTASGPAGAGGGKSARAAVPPALLDAVPDGPEGLAATATGETTVRLSWGIPAGNPKVDSYEIKAVPVNSTG